MDQCHRQKLKFKGGDREVRRQILIQLVAIEGRGTTLILIIDSTNERVEAQEVTLGQVHLANNINKLPVVVGNGNGIHLGQNPQKFLVTIEPYQIRGRELR